MLRTRGGVLWVYEMFWERAIRTSKGSARGSSELRSVDALTTELDFPEAKTLIVQGRRQREVLCSWRAMQRCCETARSPRELGPGDLVGELEALTLAPSRAPVRTTRRVRALVMSDLEFRTLLEEHRRIARDVLGAVARRETLAA